MSCPLRRRVPSRHQGVCVSSSENCSGGPAFPTALALDLLGLRFLAVLGTRSKTICLHEMVPCPGNARTIEGMHQ